MTTEVYMVKGLKVDVKLAQNSNAKAEPRTPTPANFYRSPTAGPVITRSASAPTVLITGKASASADCCPFTPLRTLSAAPSKSNRPG